MKQFKAGYIVDAISNTITEHFKGINFFNEVENIELNKVKGLLQNLSAFDVQFPYNHKIDYKLVSSKLLPNKSHHIIVKNNNTLVSPFSVSGFKDHQLIGTIWSDGFKGKHILEFPPSDIDYFMIDANQIIPEINRKNNFC